MTWATSTSEVMLRTTLWVLDQGRSGLKPFNQARVQLFHDCLSPGGDGSDLPQSK